MTQASCVTVMGSDLDLSRWYIEQYHGTVSCGMGWSIFSSWVAEGSVVEHLNVLITFECIMITFECIMITFECTDYIWMYYD